MDVEVVDVVEVVLMDVVVVVVGALATVTELDMELNVYDGDAPSVPITL